MSCVHARWPDLRGLAGSGRPVQKLWVEKAGEDEQANWLLEIADRAKPEVAAAFRALVERYRASVSTQALARALEARDAATAMRLLDVDAQMRAGMSADVVPQLEDVLVQVARATPEDTIPTQLRAGQLGYRFDLTNPKTAEFIRGYDMGLIRQVSDETRQAIQQVVLDAARFGGSPAQQARKIKGLIGLTRRQTAAVETYRAGLVDEERPADQVERMAARYADKLLRQRAETISSTETLRAANAGQHQAWSQAADRGLLNRTTLRRGWLVTPDDKLCAYCAVVPAMNPGGVEIDKPFQTPLGPVMYGPLHPRCRCSAILLSF